MFRINAPFSLTPAQQEALNNLLQIYERRKAKKCTLLGVTGSGKTFLMAHLIKELNLPALVLSPNKTLAAQLYQEFRSFFPQNGVGYFISYYDYYQPEAYIPQKNLYIAKEVSINAELERLRIEAAKFLLERRDVIIVASVSAIYNVGSPRDFEQQRLLIRQGMKLERQDLIIKLVEIGYVRTNDILKKNQFRIRADLFEIFPSDEENPLRIIFNNNTISQISVFDNISGQEISAKKFVSIFPISYFYYKKNRLENVIKKIRTDLKTRINYFKEKGKEEFAERLKQRTLYDLEMLQNYGYCNGIENYSIYFSDRKSGDPPYCLLDFFPANFLTIIDESHITVPQIHGMYEGDRSRKEKLVQFGFRLPSALDNRPLRFNEFINKLDYTLFVSATPGEEEIYLSENQIAELLVRPTGIIDPQIIVKKVADPFADALQEIQKTLPHFRVLVTTLTKKMAEKLSHTLIMKGIKANYLHSEIKALERIKILKKLRAGAIDVLIGINLLREGLDLPEVALIIIFDADYEGFLRSTTSLIQIFGRAARNTKGRIILYCQQETAAIREAIRETERRRQIQLDYNHRYQITPVSISSQIKNFYQDDFWLQELQQEINVQNSDPQKIQQQISKLEAIMHQKVKQLLFNDAALLRDEISRLKKILINLC